MLHYWHRHASRTSKVTVATTVGKTGMVNLTGKPAPSGNFDSKKERKLVACRPVRAMTSATGRKRSGEMGNSLEKYTCNGEVARRGQKWGKG